MHIPWEDLELLLAIAEEKSFSAAARRLSLTQPTVSRRVSALEARLGTSLFVRHVEGAGLTEQGARLLPAARQMARFAEEAGKAVAETSTVSGKVLLGYQTDEMSELVLWLAGQTRDALPEVPLRASVSSFEPLQKGEIDLLLGGSTREDDSLVFLGKLTVQRSGYATKSYLRRVERKGEKGKPDPIEWLSPRATDPVAPFSTSDHHLRVRAAEMGLGAVVLPRIASSGLVEIPKPERDFAPLEMHLWANRTAWLLARVRAVASLIASAPTCSKDVVFLPAKGSPLADARGSSGEAAKAKKT